MSLPQTNTPARAHRRSSAPPLLLVLGALSVGLAPPSSVEAPAKDKETSAPAKKEAQDKTSATPEPVLENVVSVSPEELVNKPQEFLGKNVKFNAHFFAWSNLALDYKPAFRSSKTHLSFLVLKPGSHIPLSELKLAMAIPKEKDPETTLFASLKDGDELELVGKVFSTALDDPWVEVLKLKRLSSAAGEKKTASAGESKESQEKDEKEKKSEGDSGGKSEGR